MRSYYSTQTVQWFAIALAVSVPYLLTFLLRGQRNNVCKTFGDYYTNRDTNPNCYYNPDVDLTIPEIIQDRGYPLEMHQITTTDNYVLTLFRIKHGKNTEEPSKKPVLLFHGLIGNCGMFVTAGRNSLAFVLADNGYDVWLANYRGTIFSKHKYLNESDAAFWNFSLNEYVDFDIKNSVEFVYGVTKTKMVFVGYSLSTAMFLTYSSTHVEHALERIKANVAIAPTFNVRDWKSVLNYIPWNALMGLLDFVVTDGKVSNISPSWRKYLCLPYPFQMEFCMVTARLLAGQNNQQLDPETLPSSIIHDVDATSIKVIHHLVQLLLGNDGQWYDYGLRKNLQIYGSGKPPQTNLDNMRIPTFLLSAKSDYISTPLNVALLYHNLTNAQKFTHVVEDEDFCHFDFFRGKDAVVLVYEPILKFLQKFT